MSGWVRLTDGMNDPNVGGAEMSRKRKQAVADVMRLMGCNHRRGDNCDHVDAIRALGEAMHETAAFVLVEAIRDLPRPLTMPAIERTALSMITISALAANDPERRRDYPGPVGEGRG